jgi:hypothetical protein
LRPHESRHLSGLPSRTPRLKIWSIFLPTTEFSMQFMLQPCQQRIIEFQNDQIDVLLKLLGRKRSLCRAPCDAVTATLEHDISRIQG